MARRLAILCTILLLPLPTPAAEAALEPEQLLAAESLLYFRYDGIDAHRKAFERSTTGELMRGELGAFIDYLTNVSRDAIGPSVLKEQLLEGKPADRLQHMRQGFNQAPHALNYLGRQGFAIGVELVGLLPPRVQVTVVFPGGADAKNRAAVLAGLHLFAAMADVPVIESKVAGRTFYQWEAAQTDPVKIAWWQEGPHAVLTIGTEKPERTLELLDKKRKNLLENPLYKEALAFKDYETVGRGFLEIEKYIKPLRLLPAPADQVLDRLGIDNVKSATLHLGFEGRHFRSTLALRVPGKRTGLLGMLATGGVDPGKLSALPPDATGILVLNLDPGELFDLIVGIVESAAALTGEDEQKQVQAALKDLNVRLGVDFRKDVLGSLGSQVVLYNSPGEGVLSLGIGVVLEVKNEAKFKASLETLIKSLPLLLGENVTLRKHVCAGAEMYTMHVAQDGFFIMPSFALHQGRLVVGPYPQIVRGYLLRSAGKLTAWKPTPLVGEALAVTSKGKAKVVGFAVTDPRPTLKMLCGIAPLFGSLADSSSPGSFDVAAVPNAQALTEPLYPNVTLLTDDGDTLRLESRSSFTLPLLDVSGMDAYFTALIGFQLLRFGF